MRGGKNGLQSALAVIAGILLGVVMALSVMQSRRSPGTELSSPAPLITPAPPPATMPGPVPAGLPPAPGEETAKDGAAVTAEEGPAPEEGAEELFRSFLREQSGRWDLCFLRLPEGEPLACSRDGEPMVSASLIKLYVMGAVFERTERGELDRETVRAPLEAMITVSDNASANALIRLLGDGDARAGMEAVNAWCARQGCGETRLNRLMLEENGLQNYTGARDCALLLRAIYRGECVSPEASREMLELLLGQTVNDRLPRGLPEGTPVAHKTGDLIGLCRADAGIVFSPGGDYVLCVLSDGQGGEEQEKNAVAELSARVYGLMNPETGA